MQGRCSPDELVVCLSRSSVKSSLSSVYHVRCHVPSKSIGTGFYNLARVHHISCDKYSPFHSLWRACSTPFGLEEQSKSGFSELQRHEIDTADPAEAQLAKPLSSDKIAFWIALLAEQPAPKASGMAKLANVSFVYLQLKSLLADSKRSKLVKKLGEANQHNRFLKRQLQAREDALINFKSELAVLELEIKALVGLADEIAKSHILEDVFLIVLGHFAALYTVEYPAISCHLSIDKTSCCPGLHWKNTEASLVRSHQTYTSGIGEVYGDTRASPQYYLQKLQDQIKDVAAAQSKEVSVFWLGMAESVQVMGSFDGWSQGEHLSPEYMGSYTLFSASLLLRPGRRRYEIKFLVDGEWKISPEYPTIGEGLTENNLLVVE
ncbi:Protein PTST chloroplastic [Bienertia sinuspersici]